MLNITPKILPALVAVSLLATLSVRAQAPDPDTGGLSDAVFLNGSPLPLQDTGNAESLPNFAASTPTTTVGVVLFYQDSGMTILSDEIWNDGNHFSFASDPNPPNLEITVLAQLVETGASQDVSRYFNLPDGTLAVQSDLPTSVPDTGTTGPLLGLSLMGLAFLRRTLCRT